jgi:16S rRNA (guanine966-N2)-methyltransferase
MYIIGGSYKNQKIKTPKGSSTRPTSSKLRESLFNICQNYIAGTAFLDLFAGSGAMGLEALSRGAAHATFIDNHPECIKCIRENLKHFELLEKGHLLGGDVFAMMLKLSKQQAIFQVIYADPPYDTFSKVDGQLLSHSTRVLKMIDELPLLEQGGTLFIEDSADASPFAEKLSNLKLVSSRKMGRSLLKEYERHE